MCSCLPLEGQAGQGRVISALPRSLQKCLQEDFGVLVRIRNLPKQGVQEAQTLLF